MEVTLDDRLLRKLEYQITSGRSVWLSGPRGSGKTTLLAMLHQRLYKQSPPWDLTKLEVSASFDSQHIVEHLVERLGRRRAGEHFLVVLDDIDFISEDEARRILNALLEQNVLFVATSALRSHPPRDEELDRKLSVIEIPITRAAIEQTVRTAAAERGLTLSDTTIHRIVQNAAGIRWKALHELAVLAGTEQGASSMVGASSLATLKMSCDPNIIAREDAVAVLLALDNLYRALGGEGLTIIDDYSGTFVAATMNV